MWHVTHYMWQVTNDKTKRKAFLGFFLKHVFMRLLQIFWFLQPFLTNFFIGGFYGFYFFILIFFLCFRYFWIFQNNLDFFVFFCFGILFKVTKVTTKCYQGYYWTPEIAKNGPKQHNKLFFFAQRAKNALNEGRRPPQGLEVGSRSGLYLLVSFNAVNS